MLPIGTKLDAIVGELDTAIGCLKDLRGAVRECNQTDISDKIGKFARDMPKFIMLSDERSMALTFVRQICTGELSLEDAETSINNVLPVLGEVHARITQRDYAPKEMAIELPIWKKIQIAKKELDMAIEFAKRIPINLEGLKSADLPKKVGWFARNMPKVEVLTYERETALTFVREVCTEEIPLSEVNKAVDAFVAELHEAKLRIR